MIEESESGLRNEIEFSIAILCYRAEEEIIPFVEKLYKIMSLFTFDWELILVANFWPKQNDRTPQIAQELADRLHRVRCMAEPKQGDMGWDMKQGLDACNGKYIGIIDGDGQFPVEAIFSCFATIKSEDYDFVKTYRVMRSDGIYRKVISNGYNFLFKALFPEFRQYRDANSKPKIMKREAYQRMELHSTDWFMDAELMLNAMRLNLKIYELPVHFLSLSNRESFVKPGAVWEFATNLLKYRFRSVGPKSPS